LPGPELSLDEAQVLPEPEWGFDSFGTSFALLDDVGGDCAPELMIGIPEYGTNTGKVWFYSGVPVDADADGYSPGTFDYGWWYSSACGDCADTDPTIHPDAVEDCGGSDLDCDGQTDKGADGAVEHWYDGDGDGHGDAELDWSAWYCDTPDHFATSNDDCDDANANVHPGATELCDDVDQDCDDVADEDAIDAHTYYADVDGDGFGDPNTTVAGCEDPQGYVTDNTDCDDADPDRNVTCGVDDPAIEVLGLSGNGCACGTSGPGAVAAAPLALALALVRRRRRR
jgi:MYXO-CTERM domain-containing protein